MHSRRFFISLGILSLALYASMSWLSLQFNWGEGHADRPIVTYVAIYLSLFALYAFACGVVFSGLDHPGIFPAMVLLGLLFRAAVLPSQQIQEDDVYRYLWDGKVFAHGINPYEYAPSEIHDLPTLKIKEPEVFKKKYNRRNREELELLNRLKWENDTALVFSERINHPDIPTIYPPLAQYVFRIVHAVKADSIYAMRIAFLVFDLAAFSFIVLTLSALGVNKNYSLVYFWSPLIIKETFNSTHLDIIGISMLCASIYFLVRARHLPATFFLSLSFLGKLYPVILLPLYLKQFFRDNRENGKSLWAGAVGNVVLFLGVAVAGYLPFWNTGQKTFEGLRTFTVYFQSNDSIYALLVYLFGNIPGLNADTETFLAYDLPTLLSKAVVALILAGTLAYLLARRAPDPTDRMPCVRDLFIIMTLVFLLSPVQNPWYLCWTVPFLCLFHSRSLILLTGLVGLYYLDFYFDYQEITRYSLWIPWFEYLPFYILLTMELWRRRESSAMILKGKPLSLENKKI